MRKIVDNIIMTAPIVATVAVFAAFLTYFFTH